VFDGTIMLDLPLGTYMYEIEAGRNASCRTLLHPGTKLNDTTAIEMQRFIDMKRMGVVGDCTIHRPPGISSC